MKKFGSFFTGALAMALTLCLVGSAAAMAGSVQFNLAGVYLHDTVKVEPGRDYTAGGRSIPAVITYEDASGEPSNYLPVQMIADLAGIPVSWSEKRNSVVLGSSMENAVISVGNSVEGTLHQNPRTPALGTVVGPFTEVSPSKVDTRKRPVGIADDRTEVRTVTGFGTGGTFLPSDGKYIVLTVTNNGEGEVACVAGRTPVMGLFQDFPAVSIDPGKTLTRAFEIAGGTPPEQAGFSVSVYSRDERTDVADVTVSLMQYE